VDRIEGMSDEPREIEAEVVAREDAPTSRPRRRLGRRPEETTPGVPGSGVETAAGDRDGHVAVAEPEPEVEDPREDVFAERQVAAMFFIATLATIAFIVAYLLISQQHNYGQYMNYALGGTLGVALLAIGGGMVVWAKKLLPHEKAVQEREPFHSPEEDELLTEDTFLQGVTDMGLGQRTLLRRTLLGALGVLPLPALLLLRDLGPLPHNGLIKTGWKQGLKLVDIDTRVPVKLGDMEIGGIQTVMPEGFSTVNEFALAPTILIRFAPGQIKSAKEQNWGVDNHVAYSKICSHAGCPISLYEQQTHHLLCPCHQSTFQMDEDAKVIFGPAARPLSQLRISLDPEGFFVADGDYAQPVGPSFWERR
jgi:ubiquinol-cytochrome c reductase iron-sulfur subunit